MKALHLFFLPFLTALLSLIAQVPSLAWEADAITVSSASQEVVMRQGHSPSRLLLVAEVTEGQEEDERHQSEEQLSESTSSAFSGPSANAFLAVNNWIRCKAFLSALKQWPLDPPHRILHSVYRL